MSNLSNLDKLQAAFNEARATWKADKTDETWLAAQAAWNALVDATPRQKGTGRSSRAGERQYKERQAERGR